MLQSIIKRSCINMKEIAQGTGISYLRMRYIERNEKSATDEEVSKVLDFLLTRQEKNIETITHAFSSIFG